MTPSTYQWIWMLKISHENSLLKHKIFNFRHSVCAYKAYVYFQALASLYFEMPEIFFKEKDREKKQHTSTVLSWLCKIWLRDGMRDISFELNPWSAFIKHLYVSKGIFSYYMYWIEIQWAISADAHDLFHIKNWCFILRFDDVQLIRFKIKLMG